MTYIVALIVFGVCAPIAYELGAELARALVRAVSGPFTPPGDGP